MIKKKIVINILQTNTKVQNVYKWFKNFQNYFKFGLVISTTD